MKRQIRCSQIFYLFISFSLLSILISPFKLLAKPYYEGKVITIIVAENPGTTFDTMSRILAKHLPKYIPGKPSFIVQNMPGAGSMLAANYLYNQAKPDGLTIGTIFRSLPTGQLVEAPGVKFDLSKFSWIGSTCPQAIILFIRSDLPYKTFDDLLKAKETINLGGTGVTSVDTYFPLMLQDYLGLKVNVIKYKSGGREIYLAIERKEVDGRAGTYSSAKPYIRMGLVRPVLRGVSSQPGIENLPSATNYTTNEKIKTILTLISIMDKVGLPYIAPPGTPGDIINILRDAFSKFSKDPQAQEEAEKTDMTLGFVSAEESLKIVNYVLHQPPEIITEIKKYIKF